MEKTKTAERLEIAVEMASDWCRLCDGKLALSCKTGKYCFIPDAKPDCAGYEFINIRQTFPNQKGIFKTIHYTCNFLNQSER